jgi:hypothetical protein
MFPLSEHITMVSDDIIVSLDHSKLGGYHLLLFQSELAQMGS